MFTLSRARTMCALTLSLSVSGLTHAAFSQVISFGDSLSDTGNTNLATGGLSAPAPYFDDNFSNGTVWVENLAIGLGLSAETESGLGGANYAWGGARTTTLASGFIPSTQSQVGTYLGNVGGVADANALYTIWTGGNDVNAALNDILGSGSTLVDLAAEGAAVASIAQDLINAGAQNILVVNLPDLGLVPGVTTVIPGSGDVVETTASGLTALFNGNLAAALTGVTGGNIISLDAFSLTTLIVANPAAFGLTNATDRCLAGDDVTVCANPGDHLFWDDLHPTAAGHELIAQNALAAVVPVPAALPLMLSALMGLGFVKRARQG